MLPTRARGCLGDPRRHDGRRGLRVRVRRRQPVASALERGAGLHAGARRGRARARGPRVPQAPHPGRPRAARGRARLRRVRRPSRRTRGRARAGFGFQGHGASLGGQATCRGGPRARARRNPVRVSGCQPRDTRRETPSHGPHRGEQTARRGAAARRAAPAVARRGFARPRRIALGVRRPPSGRHRRGRAGQAKAKLAAAGGREPERFTGVPGPEPTRRRARRARNRGGASAGRVRLRMAVRARVRAAFVRVPGGARARARRRAPGGGVPALGRGRGDEQQGAQGAGGAARRGRGDCEARRRRRRRAERPGARGRAAAARARGACRRTARRTTGEGSRRRTEGGGNMFSRKARTRRG